MSKYVCRYCGFCPVFSSYHEGIADCVTQRKMLVVLLQKIAKNAQPFVSCWEFPVRNLTVDGEKLYEELCKYINVEAEK